MNSRVLILTMTLLLSAGPALAEPNLSVGWDLRVAPAGNDADITDDGCRANPYALYQQGCPDQLNARPQPYGEHLNILDQLLVTANHYKDMNLERTVRSSAQLKLTVGLLDMYQQEAKARLSLRIPF